MRSWCGPEMLLPPHIAQSVGLPVGYSAAKEVAKVQQALFPRFRERDFILKGRAYNRFLPDGLVQVVHFVTMPTTSSLYGQFAIEVGVFIPEVWSVRQDAALPKIFGAHDCELRSRIKPPGLNRNAHEEWEALAHPELIRKAGDKTLPEADEFFDRFADRDKILADLCTAGSQPLVFAPAPIIVAIIEWHRGRASIARQHLETYLADLAQKTDRSNGHEAYVRELIVRLSSDPNLG